MDLPRSTRRLLLGGALGALSFVVVFTVDGAMRSGYSPARHPVSALSLGDRGWVQVTNFVVTGLLVVGLAVGARRALHPGRAATWGPVLLAAFGTGLVLSGVFAMDPMRGYPPGAPAGIPADTSWHHDLHDLAGLVVFASLPAAAFVIARRRWTAYSTATGIAMIGLFVAFGLASEEGSSIAGLVQRVLIVVGWTWVALVAVHLARTPAAGETTP